MAGETWELWMSIFRSLSATWQSKISTCNLCNDPNIIVAARLTDQEIAPSIATPTKMNRKGKSCCQRWSIISHHGDGTNSPAILELRPRLCVRHRDQISRFYRHGLSSFIGTSRKTFTFTSRMEIRHRHQTSGNGGSGGLLSAMDNSYFETTTAHYWIHEFGKIPLRWRDWVASFHFWMSIFVNYSNIHFPILAAQRTINLVTFGRKGTKLVLPMRC